MMKGRKHPFLVVREAAELGAPARREFEAKEEGLRVAAVCTVDAARRIVEDAAPSVILFEQTSLIPEGEGPLRKVPRLNSVVSSLAIHAPVVVIGAAEQQSELAFLVEAGAADFVERAGGGLPLSLGEGERRLRYAPQTGSDAQQLNSGK